MVSSTVSLNSPTETLVGSGYLRADDPYARNLERLVRKIQGKMRAVTPHHVGLRFDGMHAGGAERVFHAEPGLGHLGCQRLFPGLQVGNEGAGAGRGEPRLDPDRLGQRRGAALAGWKRECTRKIAARKCRPAGRRGAPLPSFPRRRGRGTAGRIASAF